MSLFLGGVFLLAGSAQVIAQQAATLRIVAGEVEGLSVTSLETLPRGVYRVAYDFVFPEEESVALTAENDPDEFDVIYLQYRDGDLTAAEAHRDPEPMLILDLTVNPPGARWGESTSGPTLSGEEIARRSAALREVGSTIRARFGLGGFRGREGDAALIVLQGREAVTVVFRPSAVGRTATYTFLDPLSEDMVEVLNRDDFLEGWVISVALRRLNVERRTVAGLTSRTTTLTWEDGRWRAEARESRPDRRRQQADPLPAEEAKRILAEATALLTQVRRQFGTEGFTLPLSRYGTP